MNGFLIILALLLAGCVVEYDPASMPYRPVPRPSPTCDFRMVDHNRRACAARGKTFQEPVPGSASCGECP